MEDEKVILEETIEEKPLPKKPRNNRNGFKTKECKVISYDNRTKNLDVDFDGYGIRIRNVENFEGSTAIVKYKGTIGKSNFEYKM